MARPYRNETYQFKLELKIVLKRRYWIYISLLILQGIYSYKGGEFFPFTTYNTFSKYRKINDQILFRVIPSSKTPEYYPEGILLEINQIITYLYKIDKVPFHKMHEHVSFPIFIIDGFRLQPHGTLYKRKRVFRRANYE